MDPFSCLAIAGALCQFLDFGAKLVKETYALYEDGESTIRTKAAASTSELQDFSAKLKSALEQEATSTKLSEDEEALQTLCLECKSIADSLADKLETLNVKDKHRLWKSLGTALSTVWSRKDILKTQEDLERLRQAIDTRMISLTRNAVNAMAAEQSLKFRNLDHETKQIVSSLTSLKSSIESNMRSQSLALAQILNRQELVVNMSSDSRTIVNIYQADSSLKMCNDKQITQVCKTNRIEEARLRKSISSALLESLFFSTITQRYDDVAEAHHDTFQWIFRHPDEDIQGRQWNDFVKWLEEGDGLYWISGKAGSGKSTLLKLVSSYPTTTRFLSTWKGEYDLYTASFYFWSSGTSLQKSQEGMLRSLLYDVLLKVPQLIPTLFPTQWAELYLQKLKLPDTKAHCSWTLSNLTEAFETLLCQTTIPMRLCLFIDGLDEYSGLDSQIANLFHKAAKSPQVKVCVSSRPHLVFRESFATQPQLRLEDLTKGDILKYVLDMLEKDEKMQQRLCNEEAQMKQLIDEIVESASGVFLWVKLIVMDLLKGLENHDRAAQLQERLRDLPTDLEDLYEHMVFKVDKIYRVEASRFYQIIAAATEQDDDWHPAPPLTILDLFLAEESEDLVLDAEPGFLTEEEVFRGIWETDLRLRSRCGGLLETRFGKAQSKQIQPWMTVSYIHRTVRDYLNGTGIRHILSDRTGGISCGAFNANVALMRAYHLQLIAKTPEPANCHAAWQSINAFITHARRAEGDMCMAHSELIDRFYSCAQTWLQAAGEQKKNFAVLGTDITTFAVKIGLHHYLRELFTSEVAKPSRELLSISLCPPARRDMFVNKDVIAILLEFGADPNERPTQIYHRREDNQSPWQNSITYLAKRATFIPEKQKNTFLMRWVAIIKMLLQNGAKVNTICAGPRKISRDEKTGTRVEIETTTTPREVIKTIYEKNLRELSALLKVLDAKGGNKPAIDDELSDEAKIRAGLKLTSRREDGDGNKMIPLQEVESGDMPRIAVAEELNQKAANEKLAAEKKEKDMDEKSNKNVEQMNEKELNIESGNGNVSTPQNQEKAKETTKEESITNGHKKSKRIFSKGLRFMKSKK